MSTMSKLFAALTLLSLWLATSAAAQSSARLVGLVTDSSGAVVAEADVIVHNEATGTEFAAKTNEAGSYEAPSLPIGTYRIQVRAAGMQPMTVTGLLLQVGQTVRRDFNLKVGSTSTEVLVSGEAPVVDSSTIEMSQVIDQKTTQEIPLNGRHFVDLSLLTPGTVTPPANGFLTAPLRGQGSFAFITAGQREDTANIMINGINLNDIVQNQITFQPSINTVAEFKMDNSTYSAQYGRNSGSIVNIATRSGTNSYHGEVFESLRNEVMDATTFGTTVKTPFKRNNFGAAFGGPIKTDRAHFFLSYEGLRQRQGIPINSLVLTDAQRTTAAAGDAAVKKLLPLIPVANANDLTSGVRNRFLSSATAPVNIDQGTGDVDVTLTSKDRVHGYLALQQDLRQEPTLQGNSLPGWGDTRQSRRQLMTISEDHVFNSALTNSIRLGYNRIHITFQSNQQLNSADFNVNSGINASIGLAQIRVTGGLDFGGPSGFPQGRGDTTVALSDTVSYLHGRHSWIFGGEARRSYNNNFSQDATLFTFANTDNFVNDVVNTFQYGGTSANRILYPAYGVFVEDSFKWKPYLTFQLGFRYDWLSTPTEASNRFVAFDPATSTLRQVGTQGFGQPFQTGNKNFQPRLGFVWDVFHNGKTILRSGYAILTDQPVTGIVTGLNSNPPFSAPLVVSGTTASPVSLLNAATVAGPAGLAPSTINPNFNNPYVQSWNLNIEQEITPTLGLTIAYVGSKGTHLRIARNMNQLQLLGGGLVRPFPSLSAASPFRPGAALGNINEVDSVANSSYSGLWVTANKHLSRGLQLLASYTFSKSIDTNSLNSQGTVLQNSLNVAGNRALSDFDVRHRFVVSGFYQLPFKGNRVVSGWQIGLITQLQGGNPLNVLTSVTNFTGTTGIGALRPDIVGPVSTTGNPRQWFTNPFTSLKVPCTQFSPATGGAIGSSCHFGNLGRNALTGPGFANMDFSIVKNTKLNERWNVQFRAEAFDIVNHANLANPILTIPLPSAVATSTFGQISGTRFSPGDFGSSRQLQMALKLQF